MKPIEGRRKNLQRNENNERRENDTLNWRSGNECDTRLTASTRDALTVDCLTRWLQLAMRLVAGAIWNLKRIAGGDIGNVAWISVALTLQRSVRAKWQLAVECVLRVGHPSLLPRARKQIAAHQSSSVGGGKQCVLSKARQKHSTLYAKDDIEDGEALRCTVGQSNDKLG
ncbi:unnamed protein product [Ceratitis capitata]|uniref:(Mediterranean fruit fly) hypothetical protein n=1 Tax=Ceratitis capitata TaxID=7213 RepID=A0A811U7T4_CERCA|nr:unnamed protein product [Ceratitis capitata]